MVEIQLMVVFYLTPKDRQFNRSHRDRISVALVQQHQLTCGLGRGLRSPSVSNYRPEKNFSLLFFPLFIY